MDAHLPVGIVEAAERQRRDIGLGAGVNEPSPSADGGSRPTPIDEEAERIVCLSGWAL